MNNNKINTFLGELNTVYPMEFMILMPTPPSPSSLGFQLHFGNSLVLASSITSKSGEVFVSMHFVNMIRVRIVGLLISPPNMVGNEKKHTYTKAKNVHYKY